MGRSVTGFVAGAELAGKLTDCRLHSVLPAALASAETLKGVIM